MMAIRAVEITTPDKLRQRVSDPEFWLDPAKQRAQRLARQRSHEHRKINPVG